MTRIQTNIYIIFLYYKFSRNPMDSRQYYGIIHPHQIDKWYVQRSGAVK